jgi:hypothetical protein
MGAATVGFMFHFFIEQRIVDKQTEHNISIAYGTNCFCCPTIRRMKG